MKPSRYRSTACAACIRADRADLVREFASARGRRIDQSRGQSRRVFEQIANRHGFAIGAAPFVEELARRAPRAEALRSHQRHRRRRRRHRLWSARRGRKSSRRGGVEPVERHVPKASDQMGPAPDPCRTRAAGNTPRVDRARDQPRRASSMTWLATQADSDADRRAGQHVPRPRQRRQTCTAIIATSDTRMPIITARSRTRRVRTPSRNAPSIGP